MAQRSIGFLDGPEPARRGSGTTRGGPPAMARHDAGGHSGGGVRNGAQVAAPRWLASVDDGHRPDGRRAKSVRRAMLVA
ncbi:hypothetical protein VK92_16965 [Burkholderia sp. LK4]|nr:hypothetical protein VL00_11370 [Burkholderia cepacia]KML37605.1 hypothetical protein VL13_24690 [Burkholderia lata]KMN59278.1 hypothetical protein VK92_16965 [Burkholderia sp. LK4]